MHFTHDFCEKLVAWIWQQGASKGRHGDGEQTMGVTWAGRANAKCPIQPATDSSPAPSHSIYNWRTVICYKL